MHTANTFPMMLVRILRGLYTKLFSFGQEQERPSVHSSVTKTMNTVEETKKDFGI